MVNRVYWIVYSTYEHNGTTTLSIPLMNQITWTIHFLSRHYDYLTHSSIEEILSILKQFAKRLSVHYTVKPFLLKYKDTMDGIVKGILNILWSIVRKNTIEKSRLRREEIGNKLWDIVEEKGCKIHIEEILNAQREDINSKIQDYENEINGVLSSLQKTLCLSLSKERNWTLTWQAINSNLNEQS
uniref:Uncharacterized protein LOC111120275 n=1 Tax=Crassostrea virginica TaxID=6565 RepID=A0A8B8CLI4_CRAVI|nr:uncharacterized protein LOC111120275 [Crassostrea virginica]